MNKEEVRTQLINTLCWMKYSGHHLSETHTLKDAYDDYYFEISRGSCCYENERPPL